MDVSFTAVEALLFYPQGRKQRTVIRTRSFTTNSIKQVAYQLLTTAAEACLSGQLDIEAGEQKRVRNFEHTDFRSAGRKASVGG
jgi:hypothetical protein